MNEYYGQVLLCAGVIVCVGMLVYRGRGDGAVRLAFGTLLLYVVIVPLFSFFSDVPDFPVELPELSEDGLTEDYVNVAEDAVCRGVESVICSELSLNPDEVRVVLFGFDVQRMEAERVLVLLSGVASAADRIKIDQLVNSIGIGRCEVEIEIG